uniref:Ras-associating domain-containing protein n=1 Tax=Timema cristinae TaxID=61476 RepID=A0A7R9GS36_TIMCR|nr:unnamed protein product [Timema cristinae]
MKCTRNSVGIGLGNPAGESLWINHHRECTQPGLKSWTASSPQLLNTTIKVYAKCLRPDIEYKTLSITFQTSCREVVTSLLNKYRMRHRDPNLFYLTMEVTVRKAGFGGGIRRVPTISVCGTVAAIRYHTATILLQYRYCPGTVRVRYYAGVRTVLVLDEEARPAALQSCHPRGDSRFSLQTRRGGLVKIYDSILMPASQYKSLLISDRTTVDELIQILLSCYNSKEQVEQFSLYEVCKSQEYQRKLHPDDCPLQVQQCWGSPSEFHFLIRRNLDFRPCRKTRKLLGPWTPELPTIPCSSRQNQPAPIQSSLVSDSLAKQRSSSSYTDYENYFYI